MNPKHPPIYLNTDEDGEPVAFNLPYTAIHSRVHRAGMYTINARTLDKLTMLHYREVDRSDVLIHGIEDKIKVVERLRKMPKIKNA